MAQVEIQVQGMHCQKCAGKVEKALAGVAGVGNVQVDLPGNKAVVELSGEVGMGSLMEAVKQTGFQAVGYKKL